MAEKRKCKLCSVDIYVNGRVVWDAVPVNLIDENGGIVSTGHRSHYETCAGQGIKVIRATYPK